MSDWSKFEVKLERALFYYRMKVGALISVLLILVSLGIFGSSAFVKGTTAEENTARKPHDQSFRVGHTTYFQTRSAAERPGVIPFMNEGFPSRPMNPAEARRFQSSRSIPSYKQLLSVADGEKGHKNQGPGGTMDLPKFMGVSYPPNDEFSSGKNRAEVAQGLTTNEKVLSGERLARLGEVGQGSAEAPDRGQLTPNTNDGSANMLAARADDQAPDATKTLEPAAQVHSLLDLSNLQRALRMGDQTELNILPPVMPVDLRRKSPYVSPLQAENPWSYSISLYPNFTFRKFKIDREKLNLIHRDFIDAVQESERGGLSLNVGFKVSRRIGDITYLNAGIEYINYKTVAEFDFYNYRQAAIDPATNEIVHYTLRPEAEHINLIGSNVYHYVNFPLSISHQPWATDHIRLNIEAGGSYMYFLTARGKSIDYLTLDIIDISDRDYRNSMGSFHFKVGATYHLSPQFNFGFEPTLMYFTNTIFSEDYPFQVIPYSVGVNLKLQLKLN